MDYAVMVGLGAMIYIPCLMEIGSDFHTLIRGVHRQESDPISLILFLFLIQNKGHNLIIR
jgi:hypothetical protein